MLSSGRMRRTLSAVFLFAGALSFAQTPSSPPPPAQPPSPVQGMRNKIAAGDLLSAESILEQHRAENGEDAAYLSGLAWLARGALLLGDLDKANSYTEDVR